MKQSNPNIPLRSYALDGQDDPSQRTNKGNTRALMALLSEMWIFHILIILGGTAGMSFFFPALNNYTDDQLWNITCYWKLGWLLPMPYTLICFFGLALPFRTPKFLYHDGLRKRRCDNLYILTVTRGNNREAVYRAWNGHKHLERLHPSVRVHVLTDEPFFFENINCYTCPKAFSTARSKYKARALEWYRQTMRYTEHDWVLHLDEESVIDDESVRRCLEFIWYEHDYHMGQGVILYNQYQYWKNWVFTVADALRVGDDLSRFQLQFSYIHRPIWGCHGSFLMNNGLVENCVTWDLGSLTEDYEFAMAAWAKGFRCGKVPGFIREQSPQGFMDFLKQRRRWFVGIWRLHHFLPKLWAFFWTLGIFSLYGTVASIPLGFFVKLETPRWFGLCKDLTFCTFVYLYILGIFVQDVDKGKNPLLVILHIPITFVVQYIAVIMEALAVMYGIVFPPKDFDVIKK
ncbi:glycosyl transferase family group 2-domain-containing protein [Cladochytrium replicatum]|nr:glycosyl transferase family group 2-domain-containing protein [Cladochytrium replicatum]